MDTHFDIQGKYSFYLGSGVKKCGVRCATFIYRNNSPKTIILPLFTHPRFIPNMYGFLMWNKNEDILRNGTNGTKQLGYQHFSKYIF